MFLVIRKVLISHISVFELDRIRPLCLSEKWIYLSWNFLCLTIESDYYALPVSDIIKIGERENAFIQCVCQSDIIHCACSEIKHSIASHKRTCLVQTLELDKLIVREIHVISHLLVEFV